MSTTVISLDEEDRRWLEEQAAREGVPVTEIVRRAIRLLRASTTEPTFDELLEAVRGMWTQGGGLEWQTRLRDEWEGRSHR